MPIEFTLSERLAGFVGTSAKKGEQVSVIFRELLGPDDPHLSGRLDQMHRCLFSKIGGLPHPARIGDLIIAIDQELRCRAFVDELELIASAIAARPLEKGQEIYTKDIKGIESIKLGCEIADSEAVVIVRSFLWKRSLFYDFGPLHKESGPRSYDLERAMGQQMTLLLGLPLSQTAIRAGESRVHAMKESLDRLGTLLDDGCDDEARYQELLASAPWMLGNSYSLLARHQKMDDSNIPDFTALRAYDECHDVVELKQPFLKLFRADGSFSATFSDAWNQAERYLDFCQRQRTYLLEQKKLRFENPRCILLIGQNLTAEQSDAIRAKESLNRLITVMSYDQLLRNARHVFDLVYAAEDRSYPGNKIQGEQNGAGNGAARRA
ncbi:MAG: Shedu anti-phage system protein SduA domain-containing protein [Verrucomicrobiales bacterium]|nr:DUF4263 domain-containing protein [Akkermansiaceae bacterium]